MHTSLKKQCLKQLVCCRSSVVALPNESLMKARLGIYEKPPYEKPGVADEQATRLETMGGYR